MFRGRTIAVVVPAYREADKIADTLRSIPPWVDRVIVVDDASDDGTAALALDALDPSHPCLEVLRHPDNRGVGAAIATGYARSLALGVDVTAVMAGDGQMHPDDLPGLLDPVVDGAADYAKGNRLAWPGGWRAMPPLRLAGSFALSWATRIASGYWRVFDSQCGYTAASRRTLAAIAPERMFARYGYPNHLLARLGALGARVVDVPVRPVYGPAWRSGLRPSRVAWPSARMLARASLARARLRLTSGRPTTWQAEGT